jgi:hypothetical protein
MLRSAGAPASLAAPLLPPPHRALRRALRRAPRASAGADDAGADDAAAAARLAAGTHTLRACRPRPVADTHSTPDPLRCSDFSRFVAASPGGGAAAATRPSPFLPPHRAVEAQLAALQRCDWPEEGAGLRCAFEFALRRPPREPDAATLESRHLVLGWVPRRTRLRAPDQDFARFAATLAAPPYSALIGAERCARLRHVSCRCRLRAAQMAR